MHKNSRSDNRYGCTPRLPAVLLACVALLLASCGSGDGGTDVESAESTSSTAIPTTTIEQSADTTAGESAEDNFTKEQALELLTNSPDENIKLDEATAECIAEGVHDITGSWNMQPNPTPEQGQQLNEMASVCITDNAPEQPSVETIEEWAQDAAALDPPERNGIYAEVGPPPMTIDESATYEAVITTEAGEMRFDLYAEKAPLAVNNFVNLAEDGFYDGLTFHRVLEDFMAQGGDATGIGSGSPGYRFDNEYTEGTEFDVRGRLAMANAGLNTNGSQFFITFKPVDDFLPASKYTVFGQLTDGDDILSAIDLRDPDKATEPGTVIESIRVEKTAG